MLVFRGVDLLDLTNGWQEMDGNMLFFHRNFGKILGSAKGCSGDPLKFDE